MLLPSTEIKTIAIFRALQLGDLLCSIPACRALRKAYPRAHIAIIGLSWQQMLVQRFPEYFDEFIRFPGYPGLPEQQADPASIIRFLSAMNASCFDLVLQMQGNGSFVNPMVKLFGAGHSAGFYVKGDYCPDPKLFIEYPPGIPEAHRHLKLMQHLGIAQQGDDLEFPLNVNDEDEFRRISLPVIAGKYICVHPGSRGAWRQWPPAFFASVADDCCRYGWQIVLTGTIDEMPIVKEVESIMQATPIIAAGKTSLGALGILLRNARGLISNCTGISHMASALKTESVVISMDGEPERWAPTNKALHSTIDWIKFPEFNLVRQAVSERFATAS